MRATTKALSVDRLSRPLAAETQSLPLLRHQLLESISEETKNSNNDLHADIFFLPALNSQLFHSAVLGSIYDWPPSPDATYHAH